VRLWEYHLCYCEGGFVERQLGTVQMLLTKPACRRAPVGTG
jgi:cyclopropane-fatty-acyl-phospholipid synthase